MQTEFQSIWGTIFLGKSGSKLSEVAQNSQNWPIVSHMVQDKLDFQKQSKNLASFHCPNFFLDNLSIFEACIIDILMIFPDASSRGVLDGIL